MIQLSQSVSTSYTVTYDRADVVRLLIEAKAGTAESLAEYTDATLGTMLAAVANGEDEHDVYTVLVEDAGDIDLDGADVGDWELVTT